MCARRLPTKPFHWGWGRMGFGIVSSLPWSLSKPPCLNSIFRRIFDMAKRKTAAAPTVPLELWRELYQAAACFQQLAPWQWMDDIHVFGVNNEHGVRLV